MAITVYHSYVSPILDAGDPDLVGPDEWNAAHIIEGTVDTTPAGSDRQIQFNDSGAFGASANFIYDNNERVVVGTTANIPVEAFPAKLQIAADGNTDFAEGIISYNGNTNTYFARTNATNPAGHTAVASGQILHALLWYGSDGTDFIPSAKMDVRVDGAVSSGHVPGRLQFATGTDGNLDERLRIDSYGGVQVNQSGDYLVQGAHSRFSLSYSDDVDWCAFFHEFSANNAAGGLNFTKSRNATFGLHTIVQNGDRLGAFNGMGSDGTDYVTSAKIHFNVDGTPGTGDVPGSIAFLTCAPGDAGSAHTRLLVTSVGEIVIGGSQAIPDGSSGLQLQGTDFDSVSFVQTGWGGNSNVYPSQIFRVSNNTTPGSHTAVTGFIVENDYYGSDGTQFIQGAEMDVVVDGTVSTNKVPMRFQWFTMNTAGSMAKRFQIDNAGIVTIAAGGKLQLTGATSGVITIQTLGAAGTYTLTLPNNDGNNGDILTTDGTGGLSWTAAGAAAIAIGSAITGGTATRVLFEGAGPVLADSANFTYNSTTSSLVLTSSATTAFAVGRTGATNPAFMIDSSATSSVTGIKVTAHTAAGGVVLEPTSSASDENLFIEAKGGGGIFLVGNIGSFVASGQDFVPTVTDTKALGRTGARWTSLFLSPTATIDFNAGNVTITHSTGALAITGASGASVSVTKNLAANTSGDGFSLINSTAATSGSQRYSPRLRLTGQGWKTLATAASQTVDWVVENTPVEATTNPNPVLSFKSQVNSLGYVELLNLKRTIDDSGSVMTFTSPDGGGCRLELSVTTNNPLARFYTDGGVGVTFGSLNGNGISFLVNSTNSVAVTNISSANQLLVDATGSTVATPSILGMNNFAAGRAARWQFGDGANAVQTAFDDRLQMYAFHGIEINGARGTVTPPSFVAGAGAGDPSLSVLGPVVITASTTSNAQLSVGRTGQTNPVFNVDTSTTNAVTGVNIKGAAATARVAMSVTSSTTDEGFSIDAKGAGTIRLGATSTGAVEFSRNAVPTANDGSALGTTALQWSDLFLATGGVINFNNGNLTLTHSATNLTVAGGSLTLAAGTATAAPLVFTAGSNLTTAADGAMEFDGQMLYFSPDGTDRRIVASSAYIRQHAAYVLANSTTNQKLFNSSTNGQILLPTGTYRFNCMFSLSGMSATSGNAAFSVAAGSGATVTNGMMLWTAIDATTTPTAGAAFQSGMVRSVTGPTNLATATTATEMQAYVTGTFEVSVSGQVIPSIALVTGITATNNIGSFFECWKLGATTDTNTGKWS